MAEGDDQVDEPQTAADVYTSLQTEDSQSEMIMEFKLTESATQKGIVVFGLAVLACILFTILVYYFVKECAPKCIKLV